MMRPARLPSHALAFLLTALLCACGGRLTPPDVPPERRELDHLARAQAERSLQPAEARRLAILLDRYDNAPERADLLDVGLDQTRARQAVAWRAWSRQRPEWVTLVARAVLADPQDAGSAALAALLRQAPARDAQAALTELRAARPSLRPITRCLVDGASMRKAPSPCAALDDLDAALAELAAVDPADDPEADRLRWTLAFWSPAPRPREAAAAADRWVRRWPRHADGWTAVGASAAADPDASATERLAWSGAAWTRAVGLHAGAFRAHAALADLEQRVGLPEAAAGHRLDAQRAVGDARTLPETWARPATPARPLSALPAAPTARAVQQAAERRGVEPASILLDRTVVRLRVGAPLEAEIQRLSSAPWPEVAGCATRTHRPDAPIYEQTCRALLIPVDDALEIDFPTARAAARAEIVVRAPRSTDPRFESHGGAPGAEVGEGPGEKTFSFALDDIDPARDARRAPRVKVRLAGLGGAVPIAPAGMVDRLVAGDAGAGDPASAPDVRRSVARSRAAGRIAEAAWIVIEGRVRAVWAEAVSDEGGWRWFDATGGSLSGDGVIVASSRIGWVGRTPSTIPRAASADLPSSSAADRAGESAAPANNGSGRR